MIEDIERCRDCACFHSPTSLCVIKKEKVNYLDDASNCNDFIWD